MSLNGKASRKEVEVDNQDGFRILSLCGER